ncbi:hypothetical protein VSX61_08410 [Brenneria populi subsp. brevivirga]|uniref:hypothetical protein n=1 Tax=Brenneria populi TaxID=1505588 RepID=UPI002E18B1D7|nr:hypothetical protein [Brenneria populi subsp. brevivirga]
MKYFLLRAGLLLAACDPAYAGNSGGQIDARLVILPACGVESTHNRHQIKCNVGRMPQPKITESRIAIPTERQTSAVAKAENQAEEARLITIEW